MSASELAQAVAVPVPCANCDRENFEIVARLVDCTEIACADCGEMLDLDTPEWRAFRRALKDFHVGKYAPLASPKKRR